MRWYESESVKKNRLNIGLSDQAGYKNTLLFVTGLDIDTRRR